MKKPSTSQILLAVAAPIAAAVVSIVISSLAVLASKKSPMDAYKTMWEFGTQAGSLLEVLNQFVNMEVVMIKEMDLLPEGDIDVISLN